MNTYSIAFASDDNGTTMLGIALYSLLTSKNEDTNYKIYILEDRISQENKEKMLSLQEPFACEIIFIPIGPLLKEHIDKEFTLWPSSMYGRLFLASLLPQEKRLVYLDIDTLIVNDLAELFHADLAGNVLGVVFERQGKRAESWKKRLGMPHESSYFNSGVLLMDLEKMRQDKIEAELLTYLNEHEEELVNPDQDVLNAVLCKRVKALHPKWNWRASQIRTFLFSYKFFSSSWGNCSADITAEASCSPCVIHFVGKRKPLQDNYQYYGKRYRELWLKSPWKNIPLKGKMKLSNLIRRAIYMPFDALLKLKIKYCAQKKGLKPIA